MLDLLQGKMQVHPFKTLPVANGYFQGAISALDISNCHNSSKFKDF